MSILCDTYIEELMQRGLVDNPEYSLLNPASLDIRVGQHVIIEGYDGMKERQLIPLEGYYLWPGQFVLLETMEWFHVPNGYALDLRLKSSVARQGFNHSMAMWVDPGWEGVLTMEVQNLLGKNKLKIFTGMRFAQAIVHKLIGASQRPYVGRYQGAATVEGAKN